MTGPEEVADIVLQILREGILAARRAGWSGDAERSAIEANYIHNFPDLLRQYHPELLTFYWETERLCYLKDTQGLNIQAFAPLWAKLEPLVPKP